MWIFADQIILICIAICFANVTLEGEQRVKTKKQSKENNNVQRVKNNIPRNGDIN